MATFLIRTINNSNMKTKLLIAALLIINYCSAQCIKLHDCDSLNGNHPMGDLVYDGTYFYGMMQTDRRSK